jgi:polyphenol oxidase
VIESRTETCEYLRFAHLSSEGAVVHGVFTRWGGVSAPPFDTLNAASSVGDSAEAVRENHARIASTLGLPLVAARSVHGADVIEVTPTAGSPVGQWRQEFWRRDADAMITDVPGFALFWAFGDCVPILLYDARHQAIGLVHAGWRGTAGAVAAHAVEAMRQRFGSRPEEMLAGIGPSIGKCCYTVGDEVRERFRSNATAWASACFEERATSGSDERPALYVDLWESNRRQLLAAGLAPDHIELAGICTGCRTDLFFSYRMERQGTGRFGVAIGLAA